jgi:collagenase-like PrtC family protease
MSGAMLASILGSEPLRMETEVAVFGRMPLAYSARCFTARHYNLQKDACEFRCIDHAHGLPLRTREGQPFLTLNGIQTQSAQVLDLLPELRAMETMGVAVARISPQAQGTTAAIEACRALLDGRADAGSIAPQLHPDAAVAPCNGFWYGRPGLEHLPTTT